MGFHKCESGWVAPDRRLSKLQGQKRLVVWVRGATRPFENDSGNFEFELAQVPRADSMGYFAGCGATLIRPAPRTHRRPHWKLKLNGASRNRTHHLECYWLAGEFSQ